MADSKISALTATTSLLDTDEMVVASGGASKKITGLNLKASMPTSGGGSGTALPYALIQNQQNAGTNGGGATAGSWGTCVLNTLVTDTGSNVTGPTSNHFTLAAGTYEVDVEQAFVLTGYSKLRLRNTTDGTTLAVGVNFYNNAAGGGGAGLNAKLYGVFTIAASKNIELQYWVNTTNGTNGLGVAFSTGEKEVYASIVLHRRA